MKQSVEWYALPDARELFTSTNQRDYGPSPSRIKLEISVAALRNFLARSTSDSLGNLSRSETFGLG